MPVAARVRGLAVPAAGLLLLVLLASCGSQENNQLGVSLLEDEGGPRAVRLLEIAAADSSADYQLAVPPEGGGVIATMLVGSRPGFLSRGLVRFASSSLPDSGSVVDSAAVEWVVRSGYGATPPLKVLLHRITADWTESETDSVPAYDAAFDSLTIPFPEDGSDTVRIAFAPMAQAWINDPSANFGMALVPGDGQDSEVELSCREAGQPTRLLVYTTVDGEVVTTNLAASADAFVLETTPAFVSPVGTTGRLTVARGLPARSLLRFTWPDPGSRATINRAEMVLFVDQAASFTNGIPIAVQRVLSGPWAGEDTEVSPLLYGVNTVYADTDSVVFTVTAIVDALLTEENDGFQVRATEERADTDIVRFHGPDTEVPGKEPHLRIWYTPGPGPETQP